MFVHLLSDTEEGKAQEKAYGVQGHPSFVLTNAKGEVVDRWVGYRSPRSWTAQLQAGLADPTTEAQKRGRFEKTPTAKDAATLARLHATRGERAEAVKLYRRAMELDPSAPHEMALLDNLVLLHGKDATQVTTQDVVAAAQAALASPQASSDTRVAVAMRVLDVAKRAKEPSIAEPFVEGALQATADVARARQRLLIEQALLGGDAATAIKLKRESMPEGWMEDPAQLNEFAWWSFENRVNLTEAEAMALKGVELSQPGADRAQILDTAAELAALRGDRVAAADLIRRAQADDPKEEHYRKQIERFESKAAQAEE